MQVQHYLAVSGYDCWYIAALIMGKEFIIRKIERDEELIQYLITIEERFWNEHVVPRVMPEPDGSNKCSEVIASMYFKSDKQKSIELNGFSEDLNRRSELVDLIAKMEKEKDAIDQRIKLEMQDAAYAISDKYKISWLSSEASRLDTKKLKEDYPELYKKYCKTTSCRRFTVSAA
jgi:predicted phage-related endonuclease